MSNEANNPPMQDEQRTFARQAEETRQQGPPTLGQAKQSEREPLLPADQWPHAKMPGDRGGGSGVVAGDSNHDKPPQQDSGTLQRGAREGERGQDDSVNSGGGVVG